MIDVQCFTATALPFRLTFVTDGDEYVEGGAVGGADDAKENELAKAPGGIVGEEGRR